MPWLWPFGADLLVVEPEPDVVGLVGVGLHAEDRPVERLGSRQVADGDDDGLDAVVHDRLLVGVELEVNSVSPDGLGRHP
jgi:hypothetical protein